MFCRRALNMHPTCNDNSVYTMYIVECRPLLGALPLFSDSSDAGGGRLVLTDTGSGMSIHKSRTNEL